MTWMRTRRKMSNSSLNKMQSLSETKEFRQRNFCFGRIVQRSLSTNRDSCTWLSSHTSSIKAATHRVFHLFQATILWRILLPLRIPGASSRIIPRSCPWSAAPQQICRHKPSIKYLLLNRNFHWKVWMKANWSMLLLKCSRASSLILYLSTQWRIYTMHLNSNWLKRRRSAWIMSHLSR